MPSVMETAGLWKLAEMRMLVLGQESEVETVLLHHSLRNILNVVYIAINEPAGTENTSFFKTVTQQGWSHLNVLERF